MDKPSWADSSFFFYSKVVSQSQGWVTGGKLMLQNENCILR